MRKALLLVALLALPRLALAACSATDSYSSVVCADTPVHYYRLDQPSGTTATDVGAGTTLNGTYTGGFTLSATGIPAISDKAVALTGGATDGYVLFTASHSELYPQATLNNGWAYEEWIKPSTVATTMGTAGATDSGSSNNSVWSTLIIAGGVVRFRTFNTAGTCTGTYGNIESSAISSGAWHYIALTTMGGSGVLASQSLYIDGALVSTISSFSGTFCSASPIVAFGTIPAFIGGGANSLQGTLDEAAVYWDNSGTSAGTLSAARVLAHYNAGATAFVPSGLNAYSVKNEIPTILPRFLKGTLETRGGETIPLASGQYSPKPKFIDYYPVEHGMYLHR